MFSSITIEKSTKDCLSEIEKLKIKLETADVIVIGAGAGLSTAAGFSYTGERFRQYFSDFEKKFGVHDMYSGGFYPYKTLEEYWAYWSRYIYINRYMDATNDTYRNLRNLVKGKPIQIVTTNVDHCFQKAGFEKKNLFYTQGDYGLFQCSVPCHQNTYDNKDTIEKMMKAQGYLLTEEKIPYVPENITLKMEIPSELVPHCPVCGKPMTMNLRADNTFVEDEGWHQAAKRYQNFLDNHQKERVLFLELGVGYNTPSIIKYPFWQMTYQWPDSFYACINFGEAYAPSEIKKKSLCIDGDIELILQKGFI